MILRSLAVIVCAVSVSAAEPSLESLSASLNLSMPAIPQFVPARHVPMPRVPPGRIPLPDATISGTIGGVAASLSLSRRTGKISGALEQREVSLDYTGDGSSAVGSAFGQGVDYAATTNENGSFTYAGHVRGQAFSYTYSDADHYVKGSIGGRKVDVTFDPSEGTATGTAGGQDFKLSLDAVSGGMTGTIEGQAVALTLVNEGLGNFLQNLYLFIR